MGSAYFLPPEQVFINDTHYNFEEAQDTFFYTELLVYNRSMLVYKWSMTIPKVIPSSREVDQKTISISSSS